VLWGLVDDRLAVNANDSSTVSAFKDAVSQSIKQRFGMTDLDTACSPLIITSVLDPVLKNLSGWSVRLSRAWP